MNIKTNKKNVWYLNTFFALIFLSSAVFTGCSKDDAVDANYGTAQITGRIEASESAGKATKATGSISGAVVTALEVSSNGSTKIVSKNEVTTDTHGKFTIEVNVNAKSKVMLVAKKGDKEWKGIVTSDIKAGSTVYSRPLNEKTALEANLFLESRISVLYINAQEYLEEEDAAEINSSISSRAAFKSALNAKVDAFTQAVTKAELGGSNEKLKAVETAHASLRAELDRDLYYAETETATQAAIDAYYSGIINACVKAGLSAETYYNAVEVSHRIFLASLSSSSSLKFSIENKLALIRARMMKHASVVKFKVLGASAIQLNAVAAAGSVLIASVKSASSADQIKAAFNAYTRVIIEQLKITLNLKADEFLTAEGGIRELKADMESSLSNSVSAKAVITAYINFCTKIQAKLETVLNSAGETKAKAAFQLFTVAYINS